MNLLAVPGDLAAAKPVAVDCASRVEPVGPPQARGVWLRPARGRDAAALERMFARCSVQTRYERFHGALSDFPRRYLAEALAENPALHDALVVQLLDAGGSPGDGSCASTVVALGSARRLDGPGGCCAELGLLVEDAWQRRGLGAAVLSTLAARAAHRGIKVLCGDVLAQRATLLGVLERSLGPVAVRPDGLTLRFHVWLPVVPLPGQVALGDPDARPGPRLS